MDSILKPTAPAPKKRVKKAKPKLSLSETEKTTSPAVETVAKPQPATAVKSKNKKKRSKESNVIDINEKYPILKNEELIQKFLKVPFSNNQKGRIRQAVKDSLKGTSNLIVPEIVHGKIQDILNTSTDLTDSQLRRIRILYNLLKTCLNGEKINDESPPPQKDSPNTSPQKNKRQKIVKGDGDKPNPTTDGTVKEKNGQQVKKIKGPKRYVVFVGNLPLDIDNEKILNHFSVMNEHIKDIRIPDVKEGKKSAIAFMELSNEASYEFALSKHHSMLGSKRINVLYTTQKNGKVTKADAKSKSAKLIALQKSGKLVGSLPLAKKRSQRRLKMKQARAKENE